MEKVNRILVDSQRITVFLCLLALGSQCTQQAVEKKADGLCRIKMENELETITEGTATLQTNTRRTTYTYTANGDLAQTLVNYQQRDNQKVINTYTFDDSYTYDAARYATTRLSKSQWKTDYDSGVITERVTYTYDIGRLSQSVRVVMQQFTSQANAPV